MIVLSIGAFLASIHTMQDRPQELTVGRPTPNAVGLIVDSLGSLYLKRRLIWYLPPSTLRNKGGKSALGNAWLVLDPTLQLAIYYLLVGVILQRPEPAFPLFLFAAILPWRWFTVSISDATESVRKKGKVMQQISFPQIVLPFAAVTASLGSFLFGLIPLTALYLVYPDRLNPWILTVPGVMVIQLLWCLPLAIFLSALNVFFRDVGNLVKHFLRLGFYISPALFSYERLERIASEHPPANLVLELNPMAPILRGYRDVFYYGQSPDWLGLAVVGLSSIPFTLIAILVFRRLAPSFAKVLS